MWKLFRTLCVVGLFVLILFGTSYASLIEDLKDPLGITKTFLDPSGTATPWLSLNARLAQSGDGDLYVNEDTYTLLYTLTVLPELDLAVRLLRIPVVSDAGITWGVVGDGFPFDSLAPMVPFAEGPAGFLDFIFPAELQPGQTSATIYVRENPSVEEVGITVADFFAQDGGNLMSTQSAALLVTLGKLPGGEEVPEPATLLLLGGGLFGLGVVRVRYLRHRGIK